MGDVLGAHPLLELLLHHSGSHQHDGQFWHVVGDILGGVEQQVEPPAEQHDRVGRQDPLLEPRLKALHGKLQATINAASPAAPAASASPAPKGAPAPAKAASK